MPQEIQTKVIDNFTGALTRTINGDLNSGLAKFDNSWGYNPFASPGILTWNLQPIQVEDDTPINGMPLAGKTRVESGDGFFYFITSTGHFYKLDIELETYTDLHTLTTGSPTFNYGSSMEFFNGKVWITNDKGLSRIDFDGTNETQVGTWDSSHFIQNTYHPLTEFQGKLLIGNTTDGTSTNFGTIDTTNTIITYATVSPALPTGTYIRDMDITSDFSYLTLSASAIAQEAMAAGNDTSNAYSGDSFLFRWNGTDIGITSGITLPNFGITALNNFGTGEYSFMYDSIGSSLYDSGRKLVSLTSNKSPLPNAVSASGNLITWMNPEVSEDLPTGGRNALDTMYFYGQLDANNPIGLWRMFRQESDLVNGSINQVPLMTFVKNQYVIVQSDGTLVPGTAVQYFSRLDFNNSTSETNLYKFIYTATNDISFDSGFVAGVYETQTQLFSKRMSVNQIRVYCDGTAAGDSFKLDLIGPDGDTIAEGEFTYTFVAGTDITQLQGSLERINFNPSIAPTFGIGVRITNNSTTNMVIRKVEIDWGEAGQ